MHKDTTLECTTSMDENSKQKSSKMKAQVLIIKPLQLIYIYKCKTTKEM